MLKHIRGTDRCPFTREIVHWPERQLYVRVSEWSLAREAAQDTDSKALLVGLE